MSSFYVHISYQISSSATAAAAAAAATATTAAAVSDGVVLLQNVLDYTTKRI
jgi:hypothetical protein